MGNTQNPLRQHGYTQLRELGQGAFGTATLVKHDKDGKQYVTKTINLANVSRNIKQRALEEQRILADLHHTYVVLYKESFQDRDSLHIVMEYCQGGDLYQKIQSQKQQDCLFSEEQILLWSTQICLALAYIHSKNILHRDIKPQNIFLTENDHIKLGDFGVAKVLNRQEEYAKTMTGTPIYLSPEVWKNKPYNNKSDMWSMGCVLHELCTLEPAYKPIDIFFIIPIWLRSRPAISETFSPGLHSLVKELLKKDPRQRPSAEDVLRKPLISQRIESEQTPRVSGGHIPVHLHVPGAGDASPPTADIERLLEENVIQLNESWESFNRLYDENATESQNLVTRLKTMADNLERIHYRNTAGSLAGGVVSAAGGITSIVGLALTPVTLGASLIVTGVGIGVAVAGGMTGAGFNINDMVKLSADRKSIESIINEYRATTEPIMISLNDMNLAATTLSEHQQCLPGVFSKLQVGCRVGRGLGGVAELIRLIQVASVGRVAAQAAKGVRVAGAFTAVLSSIFLLMDVVFIAHDAREIHSMRNSDSSSQSNATQLAVEMRKMAEMFQENLDELRDVRTRVGAIQELN